MEEEEKPEEVHGRYVDGGVMAFTDCPPHSRMQLRASHSRPVPILLDAANDCQLRALPVQPSC